jgi:tRNA-Thr(GGU) m(6)t(6)A37 methyltransferase TsaA
MVSKRKVKVLHKADFSDKNVQLAPIGIIHSPYTQKVGTPIQATFAEEGKGTIELFPQYKAGLKNLRGFSHIILIYHFHESKGYSLLCRPFLDNVKRGVFATRAPRRPNPIGLSIVRLHTIKDNVLHVSSLDILDGTPLIDIKPYIPQFDVAASTKVGWFEKVFKKMKHVRTADDRFSDEKMDET